MLSQGETLESDLPRTPSRMRVCFSFPSISYTPYSLWFKDGSCFDELTPDRYIGDICNRLKLYPTPCTMLRPYRSWQWRRVTQYVPCESR